MKQLLTPEQFALLTDEEQIEYLDLLEAEHTEIMEKNLYEFFREAWKVIEPSTKLVDSWHYEYICDWLQYVSSPEFKEKNPDTIGLLINVPPQSGKTSLITITYPDWVWVNDPARRFICASYALSLSEGFSVKRRNLIKSQWFQKRWGHKFSLRDDMDTKKEFFNTETGQMIAAGVGGTITGKHGNILILDDPLNPDQAASDAERKNANTWFNDTFLSRRILPNGVIVVVMQRLHEEDVTGMLLSENTDGVKKWFHLNIPLVCEEDTLIEFPLHPDKNFIRKAGDVLQTKRNTPAVVRHLQSKPRLYAGQFQQRPAPAEGNIIKRSWIRYYGDPNDPNSPALPSEFKRNLQSWDCTFKGKTKSQDVDYVCGLMVGVNGADRFLLDRTYRQMSFTQTLQAIVQMKEKYPATKEILIEDKANGPAVIDMLKSKITGILPINPKGDKKERLEIASYSVESGNWYFPHPSIAPWVEDFIENLVTFPNAKHDDDVDAFSQVEVRLGKGGGAAAMLAAYDQLLKKLKQENGEEPQEQPDNQPKD